MSVANPKRIDLVRDYLITQYQTITIANGFQQDIQSVTGRYIDPRTLGKRPLIQVYFGEIREEKLDSSWVSVNLLIDVFAIGQVEGQRGMLTNTISYLQDEVYKMMSDLQKITDTFSTSKANDATLDFVMDFNRKPFRIYAIPDFEILTRVSVPSSFGIKIRNVTRSAGL